jgi:hypothetical protein
LKYLRSPGIENRLIYRLLLYCVCILYIVMTVHCNIQISKAFVGVYCYVDYIHFYNQDVSTPKGNRYFTIEAIFFYLVCTVHNWISIQPYSPLPGNTINSFKHYINSSIHVELKQSSSLRRNWPPFLLFSKPNICSKYFYQSPYL